jgi:hypothetical protein
MKKMMITKPPDGRALYRQEKDLVLHHTQGKALDQHHHHHHYRVLLAVKGEQEGKVP